MPNLTIRNVDPEVVERLREQARTSGRSLEEELRRILRRAARVDNDRFLGWVDEHRLSLPPEIDVVDLIRKARDAR